MATTKYPSFWKCTAAFALASPLAAAHVYAVFYLFLGVPLRRLLGPFIAICVATVFFGPLAFLAWRRRALDDDKRMVKVAFGLYLIAVSLIDTFYAAELGKVDRRGAIFIAIALTLLYAVSIATTTLPTSRAKGGEPSS